MDSEQQSLIMSTLLEIKGTVGEIKANLASSITTVAQHEVRITAVEDQTKRVKYTAWGAMTVGGLAHATKAFAAIFHVMFG